MENFWGRRFAALLVDIVIVTLLLWIISSLIFLLMAGLGIFSVLNYWIFIGAILIIVYFTYMEGKTSTTLGKRLFKLKVKAKDGDMNYKTAFIRNLSKILWVPLIVDVILGFIFVDSNDRILDKVSGTCVVNVEEQG
ncbi:RDD family protein [Methanobacterium spitsbergense]|uniref:RDD family protein n=1 Tax=Methanobacterium spitsbergense TaxID=2874285 RepID=A0A8T5UXU8_9EURY|nr:RDD family protein [Methanobacterium spitsbergense]MBZ2165643.1 RDD family protein [Methanobacterium spitsbergense]